MAHNGKQGTQIYRHNINTVFRGVFKLVQTESSIENISVNNIGII